jgi:hypothetical protein
VVTYNGIGVDCVTYVVVVNYFKEIAVVKQVIGPEGVKVKSVGGFNRTNVPPLLIVQPSHLLLYTYTVDLNHYHLKSIH